MSLRHDAICDLAYCGTVENYWGNDYTLLPNREWSQKQKHKKQPWGNVESNLPKSITIMVGRDTSRALKKSSFLKTKTKNAYDL